MLNCNLIVSWKEWHLQAVTKPMDFPPWLANRRVGVNASGYGGTNAHAVLESLDRPCRGQQSAHTGASPPVASKPSDRPYVLIFSAHNRITLIQNLKAYAEMTASFKLIDLAYTLAERRSIFSFRAFAVSRRESLHADISKALQTVRECPKALTIAFAFTGSIDKP